MVHPAASQEGVSGRLDMIVSGMAVEVSGSFLKTARLSEEWYEDLEDPQAFVAQMKRSGIKADLFTFWQATPTEPSREEVEWLDLLSLAVLLFGQL